MTDSDSIFLVDNNGGLEKVPHQQFETEDQFQKLVDNHPDLLVGEQINPDNPPRWFVVKREAGIPDAANSGDRWSVDHFLLDQHGIPTFVEIKRSTDTRIRREVVGQMLDYAANAEAYWTREKIKNLASENVGGIEELDSKLLEFLDKYADAAISTDLETYWDKVEQNLRSGVIRLLFVADQIPTELRRIIEFLNDHMPHIEVLGVEIRQYEGRDIRALVPRVVGQTESARQQKQSKSKNVPNITEPEFFEACPEHTHELFTKLFSKASERNWNVKWAVGLTIQLPNERTKKFDSYFSGVLPNSPINRSDFPLFYVNFRSIDDNEISQGLRNKLVEHIPSFELAGDSLKLFLDVENTARMLSQLDAVLNAVQETVGK